MHNKILIVEDDEAIRNGISGVLTENNYLVETAEDGAIALDMVKKSPPDLVVLDLNLPKITGESVCSEIKRNHKEIPVIMLTAKNRSADVVQGFTLGADDYMSKPFELKELLVRIQVRLKSGGTEKITISDLTLDPKSITVTRAGREIQLSPHEFRLLEYLMSNCGKVLTRDMILNRVWQYSYDVDSRVVDVYVGYLRKKIDNGHAQKLISSVRGFGYTIKE